MPLLPAQFVLSLCLPRNSWYPLSFLLRWAAPSPCSSPLLLPDEPPMMGHIAAAWRGLSLLLSTCHWQGLGRGNILAHPSGALGEAQGGTQHFCSAPPERCSLSPRVPFLQEPQVQVPGKGESRERPAWPLSSPVAPLHPPTALVLRGLPTSPAPHPYSCAIPVGQDHASWSQYSSTGQQGARGQLGLAGELAPGHQEPALARSTCLHFTYLLTAG